MTDTTNVALTDEAALERFKDEVLNATVEDPEDIADRITARILAAGSVDEVLRQQTLDKARDWVDVPLEVRGIKFNSSDMEGGIGAYAVMDAVSVKEGTALQVACGARNVLAQLYKLQQLDAFPVRVVLREAKNQTEGGGRPMWLEAVPDF